VKIGEFRAVFPLLITVLSQQAAVEAIVPDIIQQAVVAEN